MSHIESALSKLTPDQITKYMSVFEMFDEDGNRDVHQKRTRWSVNRRKGKVTSICEGSLGLMVLFNEKSKKKLFDYQLHIAYKHLYTSDLLLYVLINAGEPLNENEAEQMMKGADKDADGTIDYEEFVATMTGDSFKINE
ncbi:calglandulin-like [Triplophysa dalaica]|uniref:calglandulin-like n=1 Tax=Triplophysa dalaica TaxID=1582913 RepID=UPI0024DFC6AC|nr:calglandulin-like [Triplophysa dalaica]